MNDSNKQLALDILSKFDFAQDIGQILEFIGQLRDLVDAFFQALGGNFGPLQDWVSDLVGGTVSGFDWLSDLSSFQPLTDLFATVSAIVEAITGSVGSLADLNTWFETTLGDIWDSIGALVNNILSALGVTGSGTILDRIMDLADEFGHMLGNIEDAASGLTNLGDFVQDIIDTLTGGSGSGLGDLSDWVEGLVSGAIANFEELMDAFQGQYSGSDPALSTIQGIVTTLKGGLTGLIDLWRIPQVSLSQLTNQPSANLLTGFGDFADGTTIAAGTDWTWDGTVGADSLGSAKATGSGALKVLTSELVAVAQSQQLTVSGKVKWQSAVGTGQTMKLILVPYIGSTAQSPILISNITSPTSNSSGFVTLSGSYTVPANVTGVRVRFTVESALTAGTVWWDDISLTKVGTSVPQQWVSGLTTALDNLWTGINDGLDEVGDFLLDLINNLISGIRRIPFVGGSIADGISTLLSDLTGFSLEQQQTKNAVVAGATQSQLDSVSDQTSQQVADTVAALKARSDEQKSRQITYDLRANELGDGPLRSGDVTVPYGLIIPNRRLVLSGQTGPATTGTAHTHNLYTGGSTVGYLTPTDGISAAYASGEALKQVSGVNHKRTFSMGCFIARSNTPRKTIAFRASMPTGSLPTHLYVGLFKFNDEYDVWELVAQSADCISQMVIDQEVWVFATLPDEYSPEIGDLMGVAWWPDVVRTGSDAVARVNMATGGVQYLPPYPNFPYGSHAFQFRTDALDTLEDIYPSVPAGNLTYSNGVIPFAQVGPDSGEVDNYISPAYWFDDFGGSDANGTPSFSYYSLQTTVGTTYATISSGQVSYNGTTDGWQGVIARQSLNTPHSRIEADVINPTSRGGGIGLNLDGRGNGLWLRVTNTTLTFVYVSGSTFFATRTDRASASVSINSGDRIAVEFDPVANGYRVFRNGVQVHSMSRSGDISISPGFRRSGLVVSRSSFTNSCRWDNFLMYDVSS